MQRGGGIDQCQDFLLVFSAPLVVEPNGRIDVLYQGYGMQRRAYGEQVVRAGCVLAARLSENPAVSVCLLEAGPADRSVLIHCPAGLAVLAQNGQANWAFETAPQSALNGRRGYQPRGKVLGGSSSINAMIYIRGQREDYDHWAALGNPGWGYDEVLPYFLRCEGNQRGANDFHGADGPLCRRQRCDEACGAGHRLPARARGR